MPKKSAKGMSIEDLKKKTAERLTQNPEMNVMKPPHQKRSGNKGAKMTVQELKQLTKQRELISQSPQTSNHAQVQEVLVSKTKQSKSNKGGQKQSRQRQKKQQPGGQQKQQQKQQGAEQQQQLHYPNQQTILQQQQQELFLLQQQQRQHMILLQRQQEKLHMLEQERVGYSRQIQQNYNYSGDTIHEESSNVMLTGQRSISEPNQSVSNYRFHVDQSFEHDYDGEGVSKSMSYRGDISHQSVNHAYFNAASIHPNMGGRYSYEGEASTFQPAMYAPNFSGSSHSDLEQQWASSERHQELPPPPPSSSFSSSASSCTSSSASSSSSLSSSSSSSSYQTESDIFLSDSYSSFSTHSDSLYLQSKSSSSHETDVSSYGGSMDFDKQSGIIHASFLERQNEGVCEDDPNRMFSQRAVSFPDQLIFSKQWTSAKKSSRFFPDKSANATDSPDMRAAAKAAAEEGEVGDDGGHAYNYASFDSYLSASPNQAVNSLPLSLSRKNIRNLAVNTSKPSSWTHCEENMDDFEGISPKTIPQSILGCAHNKQAFKGDLPQGDDVREGAVSSQSLSTKDPVQPEENNEERQSQSREDTSSRKPMTLDHLSDQEDELLSSSMAEFVLKNSNSPTSPLTASLFTQSITSRLRMPNFRRKSNEQKPATQNDQSQQQRW